MRENAHPGPESRANPLHADYEDAPDRFQASVQACEQYGLVSDIHEGVADRLSKEGHEPVLDLGCGEGRLMRQLRQRGTQVIGLDRSATMLSAVSGPRVRGEATRLPARDCSFGGVAALYVLYHLADPSQAIGESYRTLRPGGLFVACAPSRYDNPELMSVLRQSPMTFDAENGPGIVGEIFQDVEVEGWDGPFVHLPDPHALTLFLYGHGLVKAKAESAATHVSTPLTLTKRGALIWGYKRP